MKRLKLFGIMAVAVMMAGTISACGKEAKVEAVEEVIAEAEAEDTLDSEETTDDAETEESVNEESLAEDTADEAAGEEDYPKIAYIENETYYGTDDICEMVPRKAPDGVIETYVPKEIMPDAHNSANFGSEEEPVEYMFLEDDQLIVHIGESWYYFEKSVSE